MTLVDEDRFAVLGLEDGEVAAAARERGIALTVAELREIAERLGRDPSVVELYAFDAQWSEHCSYKSSRALLRRLPTTGPDVLLGPAEDAGILRLGTWQGQTWGIVVAHESHNHPSQIVPFEGAATGIGGIVRDVLCMGATVIAVADPLRFGRITGEESDGQHARLVASRVVEGIGAYGNAIGVPNIAGDIAFHAGFAENCLVNVVALGLVRADQVIHSAAPPGSVGWDILLVGKATDRSGFGGAAFSSLVLETEDEASRRGAVQVPDPFLKNVIMRASYRVFEELRREGITAGFKDLGAGGILGCTAEIVSSGGYGAEIDLDAVRLAQPDLPPAVVAVGETQERLTWVLPPEMTPRVLAIYNEEFGLPEIAHQAGASIIGRVTAEPTYVLRAAGREVARLPLALLCGDVRRERRATPAPTSASTPDAPRDADLARLPDILAHRDVCSRRSVIERYDGVVRGTTVLPAGYGDAGVIRPLPDAPFGVALSVDGNPRYGVIDPRRAARLAVCEAARNVAAVGARPVGLTDCLNFGNPERPDHYGELVAAIEGLAEAAEGLALPFVSGNVSLYNEARDGRPVPASAIVAAIGVVDDVTRVVGRQCRSVGSSLYLIGERQSALGGSIYADVTGCAASALPDEAIATVAAEIAFVHRRIAAGDVTAAHDISDGGLLTAAAEMTFAFCAPGTIGVRLELGAWSSGVGTAGALFGETGGFVVELAPDREAAFLAEAERCHVAVVRIGETTAEPELRVGDRAFTVESLFAAWDAPLNEALAA